MNGWFWVYLALLEGWLVAQGLYAWKDYRLKSYLVHAGIWGDILVSLALAYIWNVRAPTWDIHWFIVLFFIAGMLGVLLLAQWAEGSKTNVHEDSMAVDGLLLITGAMHYLYLTVGMASFAMYYLFAHDASAVERWVVSGFLMGHIGIGILQPPFMWRGYINKKAWLTAIGGWTALVIFCSLSFLL